MSYATISITPTLTQILGFWATLLSRRLCTRQEEKKMNCKRCGEQIHGFTGYIPGTGEVCHTCYRKHLQGDKK